MEKEQDLRDLLNSGNIVEFRNGRIGIIIDTPIGSLIQWENTWHSVGSYDEKLNTTYRAASELDIMRVRKIHMERQILPGYWKEAAILWERIEPKEITLQELIEKAGYKAGEIKVKVQ